VIITHKHTHTHTSTVFNETSVPHNHSSKTHHHSQQVLLHEKTNTKITRTYQNQCKITREISFYCDSTAISATKILIINKYGNIQIILWYESIIYEWQKNPIVFKTTTRETLIIVILIIYPKTKLNSVALVRKRTIPTERPSLVEVSANLCVQRVLRGQRNEFPRPLISGF
jgi:hypothetical protein